MQQRTAKYWGYSDGTQHVSVATPQITTDILLTNSYPMDGLGCNDLGPHVVEPSGNKRLI